MKKKRIGIVISNKANKTISVAIENRFSHPKYKKIVTKTKKYMAHDENNICNLGDIVLLEESRPLSKKKRWILKEIIRSSNF
jgi:small subunit ribosomal protein S17